MIEQRGQTEGNQCASSEGMLSDDVNRGTKQEKPLQESTF